jgi:pimeloyl-ACP methyl ester carboxylesterase
VSQLRAMDDRTVIELGIRLPGIAKPVSVVWGARDPWLPVHVGERLRAAIPGASLEVIESARHFSPEDAPVRIAGAIGRLLAS